MHTVLRLLIALVAACALSACGGGDSGGSSSSTTTTLSTHIVYYEVEGLSGAKSASLTYVNESGGTEQRTATLPAVIPFVSFYIFRPGDFMYISAQNSSGGGSVQVRIRVDGKVFRSATSSGAFSIATASGSCC